MDFLTPLFGMRESAFHSALKDCRAEAVIVTAFIRYFAAFNVVITMMMTNPYVNNHYHQQLLSFHQKHYSLCPLAPSTLLLFPPFVSVVEFTRAKECQTFHISSYMSKFPPCLGAQR
jgi:hypothetical protein